MTEKINPDVHRTCSKNIVKIYHYSLNFFEILDR